MINQVTDINNRLKLLYYHVDIEMVHQAADIFCLSRLQERKLVEMFCDGFSIVMGLIDVAGIGDDLGIDWASDAGQWVHGAIGKKRMAARALDKSHHTEAWAIKKYLSWFDLEGGRQVLEMELAA